MKVFTTESKRVTKRRPNPTRIGSSTGLRAQRARVRRTLDSVQPQAKLTVSQPGDVHEQEADRVADEVMRMPAPSLQRVCQECEEEISRQPMEEEEEEMQLHRQATGTGTVDGGIEADVSALRQSGGQPLSDSARAFFEPRFGASFEDVRVHSDPAAGQVASDVQARAFTVGPDIFFAPGQHSPESEAGRKLLAHELTHVLQQRPASRDEN